MSQVEALYIFDEHKSVQLYTSPPHSPPQCAWPSQSFEIGKLAADMT